MARTYETEVLVVGAGPVGLFAGLALAEQGIKVQIIDQGWRTAVHSYACALHPPSLKLLARFGLAAEALQRGRRVDTVAFYDGPARQGEVKLKDAVYPFVLVLPQSELEDLLERCLHDQHQVEVQWNHRLARLQFQGQRALAHIETLGETATGYIIAHLERVVEKTAQTSAAFVLGADGLDSSVRHSLGIPYDDNGPPEMFEVFEFQCPSPLPDEVRVVFKGDTTSVLWPLPANRCRWSFQAVPAKATDELRGKERLAVRFAEDAQNPAALRYVRQLLQEHAPWFQAGFQELDWSVNVDFGRRLARDFVRERACLLGDAAHQTSPVGMQSMNAGLHETAALAELLRQVLRQNAPLEVLEQFGQERRREWEHRLKLKGAWQAKAQAAPGLKRYADKIPPCLPASGPELVQLAAQLGLVPVA
jgi:2-polyprenyl-6-methoxyphenol hydroxylase-like FAD-dependent oxidoreductase